MKVITLNRLHLALVAAAALALPGQARPEVTAEVSFETGLAPYGEWVVVSHHGRVWRPRHVRAGWRPYFHGRWVWTDDGWFWDSDEPFSWAVYHYGRWDDDPVYGWVWVPGFVWAPAWVTWRFGGGAIGWAPLLPGFSVWWTAGYPVNYSAWVFAPERQFVGVRVDTVAYSPARTAAFFSATQPAPPRSVGSSSAPRFGGPPRTYIEHQIGRPIAPVRIAAATTPQAARASGREGVVSVYRPPHPATTHAAAHPAAARSTPHTATVRSTPHTATARSTPHTATVRSTPHTATARSAPHTATTHSAAHAATARSAPHAGTARSTARTSAARPAHTATARSVPHKANASRQGGSVPGPRAQGRAISQHRPPPAEHSGPQPQGSPRAAPPRQPKGNSEHRPGG
jgi:hypothetical protein